MKDQYLCAVLLLLLSVNLLQTVYMLFVSGFVSFDEIEHLRAAYFTSNGDIPYRDFFEHHHPLLWYLFAPFIKSFPQQTVSAIYIGRFISLFVSAIGGCYVYKIEKTFFDGFLCALVCLNLYFWGIPNIAVSALFNIKPDIYQRCCFLIGLYHLLCYFQNQKFKDLQICTLFFTLGFLFLQTAIFMALPLLVPTIYFLCKQPNTYKDFIKATIVPLVMLSFFAGLLLYSGVWKTYWQTCWLLNSDLAKLFHAYPHTTHLLLILDSLVVAVCAIKYYFSSSELTVCKSSVLILFGFELCQRLFFNATHVHYLAPLLLYSAMISAPFVLKTLQNKIFLFAFIFVSLTHLCLNILLPKTNFLAEEYYQKTNGITVVGGIFRQRLSYYWMYPVIEAVDDISFRHLGNYDINRLYQNTRPDIIVVNPDWTETFQRISKTFRLDRSRRKLLEKHLPNIEKIGNYIEIEKSIYQHRDKTPKK